MSLISLKRSSRHKVNMDLTWEMSTLVGYVGDTWITFCTNLGEFTITSAKDGKHRKGSFHDSGNAVDVRTRHLFRKGRYKKSFLIFISSLQKEFGPHGLRIFLHGYHDKGVPHLHIAYDKKKGSLWSWVK
ncbi:hypothetical protein LCGC14_1736560 [marine sediment metagenome]|uniref:Peptidase M15A C-terminal domain-containing protein n=1 Tax=marine sediment metagenome TaxID=412755 RepID=A0A0F9K7L8_9ZZZZ